MSDAIGTIGSKVPPSAPRPAAPLAPASTPAAASSQPQIQRMSPTMTFDPSSGVMITQYLGSDGKVQAQLPSTAAVAYLRVGLTATGEPRPHEAPKVEPQNQKEKNVVA